MIAAQLIEMLQLQDRMNKRVHPDWLTQDFNWARAAFVESAELLDHIGWKWWKKQESDRTQAHLELVDIWHFMLSDCLIENEGNIQRAALNMLERWEMPISKVMIVGADDTPSCVTELPLQTRVQVFGSLAGLTGSMLPALFRNICDEVGLSTSRLHSLYLQKNVLNLFRQDYGYQDGSYVKVWNGKEDNVVLAELADSMATITRASLYQALVEHYPGP